MFISGQVINKEQHIDFVNWNNRNGKNLRSVSLGNGTYRLEEVIKDLAKEKRTERDFLLKQTDKYMVIDFPITDEEKELYKSYRQYLRDIPQQKDFPEIVIKTFDQYKG